MKRLIVLTLSIVITPVTFVRPSNCCVPLDCHHTQLICTNNVDCCPLVTCNGLTFGKTHFTARSQARATYRWLVGTHDQHLYTLWDTVVGTLSVISEFGQTFANTQRATFVLPTGCSSFTLGPDGQSAVRGQDFGLSVTQVSQVCLAPQTTNFITDFHLDINFDQMVCHLFGYIDFPFIYTSIDPHIMATDQQGAATFPACLMSNKKDEAGTVIPAPVITDSALSALEGDFIWPDVSQELAYGILAPFGKPAMVRIGEIRVALGYQLIDTACAQLGIKIVAAAPTGNRSKARFVLEPIAGNEGHAELGFGLVGHALLWQPDDDHWVSAHLDSEFTHLFASSQTRLFDVKQNGPWSRYLLLKKFAHTSDGTPVYDGLVRGANAFAQPVHIKQDIQADITVLASYFHCNFIFDLGYNFWFLSREKITRMCCCIPPKTLGIKGTEPVCMIVDDASTQDIRTASLSTINESKGTLGPNDGPFPVFVTCHDLDLCSALHPSAGSNSLIGNIGYVLSCADWRPYFGIGGKLEWSAFNNTAVNQWALWAKGAINF